jgi:hypothetical protein
VQPAPQDLVPQGYLEHGEGGAGVGKSKWVDGGKKVFKVGIRLESTVLSEDIYVQGFMLPMYVWFTLFLARFYSRRLLPAPLLATMPTSGSAITESYGQTQLTQANGHEYGLSVCQPRP